jgi:hypothetical protein
MGLSVVISEIWYNTQKTQQDSARRLLEKDLAQEIWGRTQFAGRFQCCFHCERLLRARKVTQTRNGLERIKEGSSQCHQRRFRAQTGPSPPDSIDRGRDWDQAVGFRARLGPSVHILQFQKCVSYVVMKLPVLHDKVTIPSHRNVSLFHKASAPPGAWSKATQGTSPRSKKPYLGPGRLGAIILVITAPRLSGACFAPARTQARANTRIADLLYQSFVHSGAEGRIKCPCRHNNGRDGQPCRRPRCGQSRRSSVNCAE